MSRSRGLLDSLFGEMLGGALGGGSSSSNPAYKSTSPDKGKSWIDSDGKDVTKDYNANGNVNPVRNPTFGEKTFNPEYANQLETQRNQFSLNPILSQQANDIHEQIGAKQFQRGIDTGVITNPNLVAKARNPDGSYNTDALKSLFDAAGGDISSSNLNRADQSLQEGGLNVAGDSARIQSNLAKQGVEKTGADLKNIPDYITQQYNEARQNAINSATTLSLAKQRAVDEPQEASNQSYNTRELIPTSLTSQVNALQNQPASPLSMYQTHFDPKTGQTYYTLNPAMSPEGMLKSREAQMALQYLPGGQGSGSMVQPSVTSMGAQMTGGGQMNMPTGGGLRLADGTTIPVGTGGMAMRGNMATPSAFGYGQQQSQQMIQPAVNPQQWSQNPAGPGHALVQPNPVGNAPISQLLPTAVNSQSNSYADALRAIQMQQAQRYLQQAGQFAPIDLTQPQAPNMIPLSGANVTNQSF